MRYYIPGRLYNFHLTKAAPSTVLYEEPLFLQQWLTWNINREGGFVSRRRFFWYGVWRREKDWFNVVHHILSTNRFRLRSIAAVYHVSRSRKYVTRGKQIGHSKIWSARWSFYRSVTRIIGRFLNRKGVTEKEESPITAAATRLKVTCNLSKQRCTLRSRHFFFSCLLPRSNT